MPSFQCSACGYRYFDRGNFTSCPRCSGLGKPDKKCLCSHLRSGVSRIKLNVISKKHPECPIHGVKDSK